MRRALQTAARKGCHKEEMRKIVSGARLLRTDLPAPLMTSGHVGCASCQHSACAPALAFYGSLNNASMQAPQLQNLDFRA